MSAEPAALMVRLTGTRDECDRAIAALSESAGELLVSPYYGGHTGAPVVRVFVTVLAWKAEAGEGR